uniref:Uncharacterized protein n=1 Tax=Anopheles atroparvus TaxID=41427 RepID=A0A182J495_ANOAO
MTPDLQRKTYHYTISVPVCAPNIAFVVWPFEIYVDPHVYMHEVTHFSLPQLIPLLKNIVRYLPEVFEFYKEAPFSCGAVYTNDKFAMVDRCLSTMTILLTHLLQTIATIDQTLHLRKVMSKAIGEQFFVCFITMANWCWLVVKIRKEQGYATHKNYKANMYAVANRRAKGKMQIVVILKIKDR